MVNYCYHTTCAAIATHSTNKRPRHSVSEIAHHSIAQPKSKLIAIDFNGGMLTSDAGTLLLQQVEQKIQLIKQINTLIHDPRDPLLTVHHQRDLLAQRIFAIALGYDRRRRTAVCRRQ